MNREASYLVERAKWLEEHDKQIMADFAHDLKETFNNEIPSNYASTQPFFTLENARALVDMTLKEQGK